MYRCILLLGLRLSWSWSYGSWLSNYLCNQCPSPQMLWVWTPLRQGVLDTTLCDKVCQWLATGRWFSLVLRFPPQIKLTATIYLGKWNIVESGIKHHKSKPNQTIVIIRSPWAKVDIKYCNQSSIVKICIISKYPPIPSRAILIQSWSEFILGGFYKSELQISCVFAFFTLWKRVKMHVLSDQSVHITHTYCCVSKLSKFGAYLYSHVHNNAFLSLRNSP